MKFFIIFLLALASAFGAAAQRIDSIEIFFAYNSSKVVGTPSLPAGAVALWAHANTCSVGPADYNYTLSQRRGEAVRTALSLADSVLIIFNGEQLPYYHSDLDRRVVVYYQVPSSTETSVEVFGASTDTVTATDANGSSDTATVAITELTFPLVAALSVDTTSCFGSRDGIINIDSIIDGTPFAGNEYESSLSTQGPFGPEYECGFTDTTSAAAMLRWRRAALRSRGLGVGIDHITFCNECLNPCILQGLAIEARLAAASKPTKVAKATKRIKKGTRRALKNRRNVEYRLKRYCNMRFGWCL